MFRRPGDAEAIAHAPEDVAWLLIRVAELEAAMKPLLRLADKRLDEQRVWVETANLNAEIARSEASWLNSLVETAHAALSDEATP